MKDRLILTILRWRLRRIDERGNGAVVVGGVAVGGGFTAWLLHNLHVIRL